MRKRRILCVLVVFAALIGWSGASFAKIQKALIPIQKERCEEKLESLDGDMDGKVSLDEFRGIVDKPDPRVEQTFKARDANGDGFLTRGELCARKGGMRTQKPVARPPAPTQ